MKIKSLALLAGMLACLTTNAVQGAEIIRDDYTASNSTYTNNSPFLLGAGVNSGINPPDTRLTGPLAPNLRYIQRDAGKNSGNYGINGSKLRVQSGTGSGRICLSANGSTPFDFGPGLGIAGAKPADRATYDITINMDNDAPGTERMSFALATADGGTGVWDFGLQLFKISGATNYSIAHRVDIGSSGTAADVTAIINTNAGRASNEISILIRVTDAGHETNTFSSRVQASLDGGATWFYDTSTDTLLPNGFRFDSPTRFILWDIAGSAVARYDNFSIDSTYAPAIPTTTWTGGGADDNWSTGANWGGTAPASGTALIFNGTTRQANVNDITDLTAPWLAFNNGGFSLAGNSLDISGSVTNFAGNNTLTANLTFSSTAAKVWSIAAGSEVTLNNTTTVDVNGDHNFYGGGTLTLKGSVNVGPTGTPAFIINEGHHVIDGGTHTSVGGYRIGSFPTGPGARSTLTNNATLNLTASGANLRVGDSSHPLPALLDMHNSTLTMASGNLGVAYAAGSTGSITQNGGTVSGCILAFSDAGAGTGTYTINSGTLEPIQIREDFTAGVSSIYFNNATLRTASGANSAAFFGGLDLAEIQAGGLTIDTTTDVTVTQALSGSGALTKVGGSTLTLTGANTYSGNTIVQAGKLVLPTIQTNATTVQVADSTELGVRVSTPGSTLSVSSVTLGGGSFSTLSFDLAAFQNPTAPLMKVSNLAVNGSVQINVANGFLLSVGQIVLVDYDGTIGGGFNFTLGNLPPGVTATLVNNTGNSSIDLNITGVPGLRWTGATNGDWDTGTQNWLNLQTASPTTFSDGSPTEFTDSASIGNINITALPSPSAITVSNDTLPYVWSGGGITTPLIKKFGSNSVTRVESGADIINTIEVNAGSYVISNAVDQSLTTVLTDTSNGTGRFVKSGTSTMTIASTNSTYDGAIVVQEGILKLGSTTGSLGSTNGPTIVSNGATLDVNDLVAPHEPVVVSGSGVNGQGAIIDSTSGGGVANNLTDVTMLGNTTFGSPNGGRWDIRVRSGTGPGPGLRGNAFDMTKVGPGALSIACQRHFSAIGQPYWEMNLGDVFINEGSVTFAESVGLGNPSKIITVGPGASLGTYDLNVTNPIVRNILMTNATISAGGGSTTDTSVFNGSIQVSGVATLKPNDATMVVNGAITGAGSSVTVGGTATGTLLLNGANTYSGDTFVTNGTLGGVGSLAGSLTMIGGTLAPGSGGLGTLTVGGDVTLGTATRLELDRNQSPNSDRVVAGGTLTFAGTLTVVLAGGAPSPQVGDVYQLFNKGSAGSFTSITLPNLSALPGNLSWNTNNLSVNGSISVNGDATPPTISSVSHSGGNLIFSGTGGTEGGTYTVLSSTNIAEPVINWAPVSTNTFGPGGTFNYTNAINPTSPTLFFLLRVP